VIAMTIDPLPPSPSAGRSPGISALPGAQQLGLAAQVPEPARGSAACRLDALQALLAALADRYQLGPPPSIARRMA
jgi:hypothetical protein